MKSNNHLAFNNLFMILTVIITVTVTLTVTPTDNKESDADPTLWYAELKIVGVKSVLHFLETFVFRYGNDL